MIGIGATVIISKLPLMFSAAYQELHFNITWAVCLKCARFAELSFGSVSASSAVTTVL
jgi:hypothetical protein